MTFLDSLLNPIFQHFWSALLFFVILNLIIGKIVNAVMSRRRDTLIKQDYKKMENSREHHKPR